MWTDHLETRAGEVEAYEVDFDPERRMYLAQGVAIDFGSFFTAFSAANDYLPPDKPLVSMPIASGIGFAAVIMVRWGTDFVRRGGRHGSKP